jgi:hypothetical protein
VTERPDRRWLVRASAAGGQLGTQLQVLAVLTLPGHTSFKPQASR